MNKQFAKLMELIDAYAEEAGKHNEYDNTYFLKQARDAVVLELKRILNERTN